MIEAAENLLFLCDAMKFNTPILHGLGFLTFKTLCSNVERRKKLAASECSPQALPCPLVGLNPCSDLALQGGDSTGPGLCLRMFKIHLSNYSNLQERSWQQGWLPELPRKVQIQQVKSSPCPVAVMLSQPASLLAVGTGLEDLEL